MSSGARQLALRGMCGNAESPSIASELWDELPLATRTDVCLRFSLDGSIALLDWSAVGPRWRELLNQALAACDPHHGRPLP
ncbi:MAG: hypothetical protein WD793_13810 [Steroidobacteraceae bacterium]